MKLYILKDQLTDRIISITEYKYAMKVFCMEINFNQKLHQINVISKESKINHYLSKYQDLYLVEYDNFIIREKDIRLIEDLIESNHSKIKSIIESLYFINESCIMSLKEHKQISETNNILQKYSKRKNIKDFINLNDIISGYLNNHQYQQLLEDNYKQYEYQLNKEQLQI